MPPGAPGRGFVVALLGAESTGKSTLARALREALIDARVVAAERVAIVTEYLREFCDAAGRTPRADEQRHIAAEQTRRIEAAAAEHDLVIADTTALMTAVYHEWVFGDRSLYPSPASPADVTLLTALDLPWQSDVQRDGPHVREPIDALIRAALDRAAQPYAVVHGVGAARVETALTVVRRAHAARRAASSAPAEPPLRWRPVCERCGDPACERMSGVSAGPPTPGAADRSA